MREARFEIPVVNETLEVSRFIGEAGVDGGNTVLFIGGVHGNETAGIGALNKVFNELNSGKYEFAGKAIAIIGNLEATRLGQRYLYKDMNRIWTRDLIDDLHYGRLDTRHTEYAELQEVYDILQDIISKTTGKLFVVDLHTTSSPTIPFIVTNNLDQSISFTRSFPMPVISGLTGFLDGTLLSYVNDLGHTGLAYEAGQHYSSQSLIKHESFVWLSLHSTGVCTSIPGPEIRRHHDVLQEELVTRTNYFKLISRYKIREGEEFKMNPGYANFQKIYAGEELATNQDGPITSPYDGYIFMPLYQSLGDDGFFIVKPDTDS